MAGTKCKHCKQFVRWSNALQALVTSDLDPNCPKSPSKAHSV